jgi:hypothetical protein
MSIARPLAVGLLLTFGALVARAADQTLLGNQLAVKNPSTAVRRQIVVKAREHDSPNTIVGDPVAAGGSLTITANGGAPTAQTYLLPNGTSGFTQKPFWSGDAASGFKYRDARGENGAVKLVRIRKTGDGTFTLKVVASGKLSTVGVLPPDPGASGCVLLRLDDGDTYSVAFVAGDGVVVNDGGRLYKHSKVGLEGTCVPPPPTTSTSSSTSTSSTTTATTTTVTSTTCGPNADGGPDRLRITAGAAGTDLDLGLSGQFHNFPLVSGSSLELCLAGCDGVSDTTCEVTGAIVSGSPTFGPPHPVLASNVPVCIVTRVASATGTADEATGDISLGGTVVADVFLTSTTAVCPQCTAGTCDGGANAGMPCTVDATYPVLPSSGTTQLYDLSSTCVPDGPPETVAIASLALTSGATSPLHGAMPCPGQLQSSFCGVGACNATCTGTACVATVPDPIEPSQMVCIDARGGISQTCCSNNTLKPCFARDEHDDFIRTGRATVPQPPLPDSSHPKTHEAVLASTFCIPPTGKSAVDLTAGLPGPGAMLLHGTAEWTKE